MVAFGHAIGHINNINPKFLAGLGISSLMVFFHVLSGFTLAYIYPELKGWGQVCRFWLARIGRIWPTHVLLLVLVAVFFSSRQPSGPGWWWCLLSSLTLTQSWFPAFGAPISFNGPAWTLSTEFALYLVFPLLITRWRTIWRWALPAFFVLSLSVTWYSSVLECIPGGPFEQWQVKARTIVYVHPATRLFEFSVGMTAALFWEWASARYRVGASWGTVLEIGALVLAAVGTVGTPMALEALNARLIFGETWGLWLNSMALPLVPFACLIMIFSFNRGWVSRIMSSAWMVFLGELSYTIYLVHTPLVWAMESRPLTSLKVWSLAAAFWTSVLLAAHLIHVLWEQPLRRFFRNLQPGRAHKSIPDERFASLPRSLRWKLPVAEFALLSVVLSTVLWEKHFRPHLQFVTEAQARKIAKKGLPGARHVRFADAFALEGFTHEWSDAGLQLQLVWRSLKDQRLDYVVAVHCIDGDGKLLGGADHPQEINQCRIASGDLWVDTVTLSKAQLQGAASIGFGMYRAGGDLIPIDRGRRDWRGGRLLFDLASELSPPAVESQQGGQAGHLGL